MTVPFSKLAAPQRDRMNNLLLSLDTERIAGTPWVSRKGLNSKTVEALEIRELIDTDGDLIAISESGINNLIEYGITAAKQVSVGEPRRPANLNIRPFPPAVPTAISTPCVEHKADTCADTCIYRQAFDLVAERIPEVRDILPALNKLNALTKG